MTQFKVLELCLKYPEVVDLLNEQKERIQELESEVAYYKSMIKSLMEQAKRISKIK